MLRIVTLLVCALAFVLTAFAAKRERELQDVPRHVKPALEKAIPERQLRNEAYHLLGWKC